jgi:DNA invertase Pin-like site-specific DNA recombinase
VRAKGASLKATEQPTDTSTAAGKCRHAGRVKGRPASTDAAQVRGMKAQGMGATDIAKALGIGRASVYRSL